MILLLVSVAVNALLIGLVYLIARKRINRLLGGDEAVEAIEDEVGRLIVELNQTADRNIAIIEERIARLKKLVDEADRKITLLGKESEKVRIGAQVYDRLKKSRPLVWEDTEEVVVTDTSKPNREKPSEEEITPLVQIPARRIAAEENSAAAGRIVSADGGTADDGGKTAGSGITARVLELHRQGFEPKIIASKTGSTLGVIELIISLAAGGR